MASPKYSNRRHKELRAKLAVVVASGRAQCAETICLMPSRWIEPGATWDVAHNDDGLTYKGPAHERCNRSDGARRGNAARATPRRRRAL